METNPVMETMKSVDEIPAQQRSEYRKTRQLYKSPLLAGLLSMMPGLGQVYLGYYKHGFLFTGAFFGLVLIASSTVEPVLPVFVFICTFFYFFNIIDAIRRAKIYNQVIDGISHAKLPDAMDIPHLGGSIGLGTVLVAAGFILFLHTMFGMSLAWIGDWWPAGVIGFGAYLIYKDLKERNTFARDDDPPVRRESE